MAQIGSYTYAKKILKQDILKKIRFGITKWDIATVLVGFLLSMASPLPGLAPFGIAYLAQERSLRLKTVFIFLSVCLGGFVACGRLGCAKYAVAGLVFISCLFILKKGVKINDVTAGLIAGGGVLISGLAAEWLEGFSVLGVVLLLCEVALTVSATLMMEKSIQALNGKSFTPEALDGETKLSLAAVLMIVLLGFGELYIGSSLSVMMTLAATVLLVVSAGCGAEYSTGTGVVLGVVCGIGSDFFMPILGAFSFCGFLSGVFSKFGKSGVIAGVVLANGIMAIYTGSAMESVLSLYEVMVAAVLFAFVPRGWIDTVKSVIYLSDSNREGIVKIKSELKHRLNLLATLAANVSKTLNGFSTEGYSKSEDASVLFDRTADKVCSKCRKSSACWGKDYNSTYNEFFKLLEVLDAKGVLKPEDITERLGANCSNQSKLVEELNHQYDIYRVHNVCSSKITESRRLVANQLGGMSEIIEKLSRDIDEEVSSKAISACEIRARLEMSGVRVKDIKLVDTPGTKPQVELVVKARSARGKSRRTIEKVVKSISGCSKMTKEEILDNKRQVRLVFSAEERFEVKTQHASRGVHSQNGDSFKMLHLKGGKFVIILSDGMGTGERAAKESRAILELIDSFLEAGFDCLAAVKMINSIMVIKSEQDAFVTIDLCMIDLFTGEVRFIKTGAEPSFILNENGRVRTVKTKSLPVGLVANAEAQVVSTKIQSGDKILMMTDGVSMSGTGSLQLDGFLENKTENDELSTEILNYAIEQNHGMVRDDMTVLSIELKAV